MDEATTSLGRYVTMEVLRQEVWRRKIADHEQRSSPWVESFRQRKSWRKPHPIYDFLFEYYKTKLKNFTNWRPMLDMALEGEGAELFLTDGRYHRIDSVVRLNVRAMIERERRLVRWVANLVIAALSRPAKFGCFGLHEWAMVYKTKEIRHETTPLRPSSEILEKTVESLPICCTHYDAFRFFTPNAVPLNTLQPTQEDREKNEQFGCVHFNMDLYKWSYKLYPWIGSDLQMDCFELAIRARELDMRASPYDLAAYNMAPIKIETAEGRIEYKREQEALHEKGKALGKRLLGECQKILDQLESMKLL
ncbi:hypothetical protein MLD52_00185 [Puniceicoccaceae bacterium K14]|nr:hypothetical protein [Puniceicoccaceae bacterium K14]